LSIVNIELIIYNVLYSKLNEKIYIINVKKGSILLNYIILIINI
jgi:hypothetical protein